MMVDDKIAPEPHDPWTDVDALVGKDYDRVALTLRMAIRLASPNAYRR